MAVADGVRPADARAHIERILAEESRLLASLERLLHHETEILRGNDVEAIERIGSERHQCIDALTRLDEERTAICRLHDGGTGLQGFGRVIEWCDPGRELHARWQGNLDIARRCKNMNDRNGVVVTARLNRVQGLLGKLRGTNPPPTYGPRRGETASALGYRDLGSA